MNYDAAIARQNAVRYRISTYEDLNAKWKGTPQEPNLWKAIKSGIGWGVAFYIFEEILHLFIGFIFIAIFGKDLYELLNIALAIVVAIYNAKQNYDAQKKDYEYYTTTDISSLQKEYQSLERYITRYREEHKDEMRMRAIADMRDQQMREAARMRNLKEEELKLQHERNLYAEKQNLYAQQQIDLEKNAQEIEREKLYHLRKIREDN